MKKIAILLISIFVLLNFSSCTDSENTGNQTENTTVIQGEIETTNSVTLENKYIPTQLTLGVYNKENVVQYYHITFPTDEGREILYGQGSVALDGTVVFTGGSFLDETIECDSIENIFPSFVERWKKGIESLRHDSAYSDFEFKPDKTEMTEINGISMCRYEGIHTYNLTDFKTGEVIPYSCYFVAYGTELSEGGYVYWIVFDDSEDQSLKSLVKSNAENMAKSLEETTIF